jgi:YVTN family beta-propeller protein
LFTANFIGGTGPYTYNYQVINAVTATVLGNMLISNAFTSNTWLWQVPLTANSGVGNTIEANILITDSATTNEMINSIYTSNIVILSSYTQMSTPTLTLSNALIDQGQSILFTTSFSSGTSPYTYNYQIVNSITGATIANMLFTGNSYTSNTFLWTPPANLYSSNTFKANVIVTDAHPTTVNSIYNAMGYNSAAIITITASNVLLDSGQTEKFTLTDTGGTGPQFNSELYNATGSTNQGSNVIIQSVSGTNTISFQVHSTTNGNAFQYNGIFYDEGTTTAFTNNSVTTTITVNTILGQPTISASNTLIDQNQYTVIATYETGGTLPYTYNFLVFNTVSNTMVANMITTSNSFAFQSNSFWTSNSPLEANVFIEDSASTNTFVNSINSGNIIVNSILTTPTIAASNTLIDQNQYTVIASYETGGTLPYTYNFLVFNAVSNTIVANMITTSNSFAFQSNSFWTSNSPLEANVFVEDSSPTNTFANSVNTANIAVNSIPTLTVSASNTVLDSGQTEAFVLSETGGIGSKFNTELYNITGNLQQGSNVIIQSIGGSNTISFTVASTTSYNSFVFGGNSYDEGTTTPFSFQSSPIVNTIKVGSASSSPYAVAFNPSGTLAYVLLQDASAVNVINVATNTVVNTIAVGSFPYGVAFTPSGSLAYITNDGSGTVNVINVATNTVVNTITVGSIPQAVAINPSGTLAYIGNEQSNTVNVISVATNTIINTIVIGGNPKGIAFNPSGTLAYITNVEGTVNVISVATNTIINTITVGSNPYAVVFNPSGTLAYVTTAGTVNVINVATNTVVNTIIEPFGEGLSINPSGTLAYVVGQATTGTMNVINIATNTIINTIKVGTNPIGIALNPSGTLAYIANDGSGTVNVVNTGYIIVVNPVLATPTLAPSTNTITNIQSQTLTGNVIGGTPPYTYNYIISNGIGIVFNALYVGNYFTSNAFTFSPTVLGTYNAELIITDSASIPVTANSVNSIITVISSYNPLTTPTLTLSNTLIDQGQSILFTSSTSNGVGPYTYNYLVTAYNSQTSANAIIANMLFTGNTYTSNTWLWTPNPNLYIGNTMFEANVVITDAHPTTVNSIYNAMGYNSAAIITITASNVLLDSGQTEKFTLTDTGGTGPQFNSELYNATGSTNQGSNVIIQSVSGTNTISFQVHSTTNGNAFQYNGIFYDEGTTTAFTNNSVTTTITVNTILGQPTISASNTLIDQNQYTVIATYETGGTLPYTYNFLVFNTVSNTIVANMITTSNSFAFQSNSFWVSNSPLRANVFVLDSATTNTFANSINTANVYVAAAPSVSIVPLTNTLTTGQLQLWTATVTGGQEPFTYNWNLYNSISLVSNALYPNNAYTQNQFGFTFLLANTYVANVFVTDSATTHETFNSVNSIITVLNTCTFSVSNSAIGFGNLNPGISLNTQNTILITNTGTGTSNVFIAGSSWSDGFSNSIGVTNTLWSFLFGTSYSTANQLTSSQKDTLLSLGPNGAQNMFFGVKVPSGQNVGTYGQTINVISSC